MSINYLPESFKISGSSYCKREFTMRYCTQLSLVCLLLMSGGCAVDRVALRTTVKGIPIEVELRSNAKASFEPRELGKHCQSRS